MADSNECCIKIRAVRSMARQSILYAEAEKDFVDMLFNYLLLPLPSIIKLLSNAAGDTQPEAINNIYKSVRDLDPAYMNCDTQLLLNPKISLTSPALDKMLPLPQESKSPIFYNCNSPLCHYFTATKSDVCICGSDSAIEIPVSKLGCKAEGMRFQGEKGYVKEGHSFIITDDLTITPATTLGAIALLKKLGITLLSDLEVIDIDVNSDQAAELLSASLHSTTPLNDVFSA